jgi:pimeloyl-ACP methyl ester carboxylesterase
LVVFKGYDMISIGTHSLWTSITGPPCKPQEPIIIILTGAGDVASSYTVIERLVSPFARIFLYDRSGLGRSETGPNRVSAVAAAVELHTLLQETHVSQQPLLLVAHSYGAIVAREYLHLHPEMVAGMVLSEGSTERQSEYFQIPDPNIIALLGSLNFAQVTGLKADSKLTRDEWRARAIDISKGTVAAQAEAAGFVEVCATLGAKEQYKKRALDDKPLSVIRSNSAREYERIYKAGVEAGNGTEEQRADFRRLLDRWDEMDREIKEEQLQLSSNTRLVHIPECGHNVHLVRPDVVCEEIRWVRDKILSNTSPLTNSSL